VILLALLPTYEPVPEATSALDPGARPARRVAVAADPGHGPTRDHGHGRIELRTLKVAAVAGLCFPHAAQAIQVIRRVRAPAAAADAPSPWTPSPAWPWAPPVPRSWRLASWHWRIENWRHWVRDVDLGEDASLRAAATSPRDGQPVQPRHRRVAPGRPSQLAAALGHTGRDPAPPLAILGLAYR
jgi:hypothetical protein